VSSAAGYWAGKLEGYPSATGIPDRKFSELMGVERITITKRRISPTDTEVEFYAARKIDLEGKTGKRVVSEENYLTEPESKKRLEKK